MVKLGLGLGLAGQAKPPATAAPSGPPVLESIGTLTLSAGGTTEFVMDVPTHDVDDLLLCFVSYDMAGIPGRTVSASAGWTTLVNKNNGNAALTLYVFARLASGSDALTLTASVATDLSAVVARVTGHAVSNVATDIVVPAAVGLTTGALTVDPPATGTITLGDYLVVACCGYDVGGTGRTISGVPSGYTSRVSGTEGRSNNDNTSTILGVASLGFEGITSEDPGVFTASSSDEWSAATLAIPA